MGAAASSRRREAKEDAKTPTEAPVKCLRPKNPSVDDNLEDHIYSGSLLSNNGKVSHSICPPRCDYHSIVILRSNQFLRLLFDLFLSSLERKKNIQLMHFACDAEVLGG